MFYYSKTTNCSYKKTVDRFCFYTNLSTVPKNDNDNVYIFVKDTGSGMSNDVKKHIFDKFFQGSDYTLNRKNEGNGLGLFIVNALVKMHNGKIFVESEEGKGSTFKVVIPITIVDNAGNESTISEELRYMANIELSDIQ